MTALRTTPTQLVKTSGSDYAQRASSPGSAIIATPSRVGQAGILAVRVAKMIWAQLLVGKEGRRDPRAFSLFTRESPCRPLPVMWLQIA